jgi:hypothetical protein
MKIILIIFILLVNSVIAKASNFADCTHYWLNGNLEIPSGKLVGEDVGQSPFGSTGIYRCKLYISASDLKETKYLFIGEVGDASFFRLDSIDDERKAFVVTHGLEPDSSESPTYLRYLPFVINIHTFFERSGTYSFEIRYTDIVPLQVGLRSGVPALESTKSLLKRILLSIPALIFHIFQIGYLIISFFAFIFWSRMKVSRKAVLCSAALFGAFVVFQITAVPRSFLSPEVSLRLTVLSQFFAIPWIFAGFLEFYEFPIGSTSKKLIFFSFIGAGVSIVVLSIWSPFNYSYFSLFSTFLTLLAVIPLFAIGIMVKKEYLLPNFEIKSRARYPILYLVMAVLWGFDVFNLGVLHGKYYYFNHYFFYLGAIV